MNSTFSAADIAGLLKLHRSRGEWRGRCPSCGYAEAFVLSVGKGGRSIGWCASCQDKASIAQLLAEIQGGAAAPAWVDSYSTDAAAKDAREARAFERAMSLWHGSSPVGGTIAERYLTARGLPHLVASAALRFRPDCPHPSHCKLPALVALVQGVDSRPVAIHRTFLKRDGSSKADIEPPRASLGPVRGGAVHLASLEDVLAAGDLVIGEGSESAASAGRILGLPAWAAISAGNLEHALQLPPQVRSVVIAADPDVGGRRAANAAWHRWTSEGRRVRISTPNGDTDFNDILRRRMAWGESR